MKKDYAKVTISINAELLKKIEVFANGLGINRSSAISVLVNQALEYKEAMDIVGILPGLIDKIDEMRKETSNIS